MINECYWPCTLYLLFNHRHDMQLTQGNNYIHKYVAEKAN
jgi:hypothetical protein